MIRKLKSKEAALKDVKVVVHPSAAVTHWLHTGGSECICWAAFTVSGPNVWVLHLDGATGYTDAKMTREDARVYWKKLMADGYRVEDPGTMTVRRLRALIRD